MPAACARPRASPPGTAARASPCQPWRSRSCQPLTPRRATWLVLRREAKRTEAEAQQLAQLRAQQAEVAEAIDLAQDFATPGPPAAAERLDPWLQRATTSALEAMRRFATGLYEDYEAVKAGVTLALEYRARRGAYQSPQNAEAPDVWPGAPRSPQPPLCAGPPRETTPAAGPREQPQVHAVAA